MKRPSLHHVLFILSLTIPLLFTACRSMNVAMTGEGSANAIPIIDTHIHLYDPTRAGGLPWPPPDDAVLYKPVLPADFDKVAKENGITATVIVEASEWPDDNQWILDLVKHSPRRYIGLVGSLEIGTPDFAENLKRYSADKRYVGIRLRERPRGDDFFNEDVWRDLKLMAGMDQTLDVLMFQFSLKDIDLIATEVPDLRILINHVAGADIDGKTVDAQWATDLKQAASHPNVYCKVSGLFQQSHQRPSPKVTSFYRPVLDELWNTFGENRLIYGSNWPVTRKGGSYEAYKRIVIDYFTPKGRKGLEKLLHQNAQNFYGLPDIY